MPNPDVAGAGAGAIAVRGSGFRIWTRGEAGGLVIRTWFVWGNHRTGWESADTGHGASGSGHRGLGIKT